MQRTTNSISHTLRDFDQLPDSAHIRPKTAAQLLGVSIASFWRLIASGKLKTHKLTERTTSVKAGDLRAFIDSKAGV
ncbi:MAG: hypothetical protein PSV17_03380 [Methylotenera sp.]|uniref:helix-turn-helix transcriptional regulator n=1 Tax=Methylotenera sp. TaxID=2051956 RepID=UPI0024899D26|nr:hypothetical protein [Methylotenera sp.]MDI1308459.1 hypothetical protein [Methylotenera sp.]